MRHIIQKQELLLNIDSGLEAFRVQQAASTYYRDKILPMLEKIFDEISGEDKVIFVNRLVIDLGNISEKYFANGEWDGQIYKLMKEEFFHLIRHEPDKSSVIIKTVRENALEQWWFYMEHGRLPWNLESVSDEWHKKVLEIFSVDFAAITVLRKIILEKPPVLRRIVSQNSGWFLETLVAVITSAKQDRLAEAVEDFCRIIQFLEKKYFEQIDPAHRSGKNIPMAERVLLRKTFSEWFTRSGKFLKEKGSSGKEYVWQLLLKEAAGGTAGRINNSGEQILLKWLWEGRSLMKLVNDSLDGTETHFIRLFKTHYASMQTGQPTGNNKIPGSDDINHPPEKSENVLNTDAEGLLSDDPGDAKISELTDTESMKNKTLPDLDIVRKEDNIANRDYEKKPTDEKVEFSKEEIDEEGIYIHHAGVILLHPFLSTFFNRLQLWNGEQFIDIQSRMRAVVLLHYLVTGEKTAPEYELVLAKMLCGYSLELPIPGEIILTEQECGEAVQLLETVTQRWEKLQSTSVEGLREGFLKRQGKLFNRNGKIHLQVESKSIDVLLDFLPWNLSIVRLPWLKDLLHIEWR